MERLWPDTMPRRAKCVNLLLEDSSVAATFKSSLDGAWQTPDPTVAIDASLQAIKKLMKANKYTAKDVCFVMDLDDTVVFERAEGEWDDGEIRPHPAGKQGMAELRRLMVAFFEKLKGLGKVYFVTARESSKRNETWTVRELKRKGIRGWQCLYMCPYDMRSNWGTIAAFKRNARREIERKSKRVNLLSVGDKWSDILAHQLTKEQDMLDAGQDKYVVARISERGQRGCLALKLPCRASRRAARRKQRAAAST